jgi:hypothetical protein
MKHPYLSHRVAQCVLGFAGAMSLFAAFLVISAMANPVVLPAATIVSYVQ